MKKILFLLVVFAVTISTGMVFANTIRVDQVNSRSSENINPARVCYAMDIVFLIDQSASMSGNTYPKSVPNDPLGQRFMSPRYALDWLANNRLGLCPGVVHRIGVISFGTEAEIDLPLTRIEPSDQKNWDDIRTQLEAMIKERNLEATNPKAAFILAAEMLKSAEPLGTQPRKRAIVLLTDGQPCVPDLGSCSSNPDDIVNKRYMQELTDFIDENFQFDPALQALDDAIRQAEITYGEIGNIPDDEIKNIFSDHPITTDQFFNSTYVYILAMNAKTPYLDIVRSFFEHITAKHGGEFIDLKQNEIDVPKQFNRVLSQMAGVTPQLFGCGNLAVDPYLSGAVLDVFKMAEGLEVEIKYDGKSLKAGQGDDNFFGMVQYGEFGAVEHYRFVQPAAGLWQIDATNCNGIESAFIPFKAEVFQLEPPAIVPQFDKPDVTSDPDHPYYLSYRIEDTEQKLILQENNKYPLKVVAKVTDPDGEVFELSFAYAKDGVWRSVDSIPTNKLGDYKVEVEGRAECVVDPARPGRCPEPTFQVFKYTDGIYTTKVVSPFKLEVVSPIADNNLPLHGTLIPEWLAEKPVEIRLKLLDENQKPLKYSDVFLSDPTQALMASLLDEKNVATDPVVVQLQVDPEDPTMLIGMVEKPQISGINLLIVDVSAKQYNHEKYIPYEFPVSISFPRYDPLLQNPVFYRVLSWIFLLVVVVVIIYVIRGKTRALRGQLIFTSGVEKKTVPLSCGWYRKVIDTKNRELSGVLREAKVQKVVVSNSGIQRGISRILIVVHRPGGKRSFTLADSQKTAGSTITIDRWTVTYSWGGGGVHK